MFFNRNNNNNNNNKTYSSLSSLVSLITIFFVGIHLGKNNLVSAQQSPWDTGNPIFVCNSSTTSTYFISNYTASQYSSTPLVIYLTENCASFSLTNQKGIFLHSIFVTTKLSSPNVTNFFEQSTSIILDSINFTAKPTTETQGSIVLDLSVWQKNTKLRFTSINNIQRLQVNSGNEQTTWFLANEFVVRGCSFYVSPTTGQTTVNGNVRGTRTMDFSFENSPAVSFDQVIFENNIVTSSDRSAGNAAADFPFRIAIAGIQEIKNISIANNQITLLNSGVVGFFLGLNSSMSLESSTTIVQSNDINVNNNIISLTCTSTNEAVCQPNKFPSGIAVSIFGWAAARFNFRANNINVITHKDLAGFGLRVFNPVSVDAASALPSCSGNGKTIYDSNTINVTAGHIGGITHRAFGNVEMTNNIVWVNAIGSPNAADTGSALAPGTGLITTFFCISFFNPPGSATSPDPTLSGSVGASSAISWIDQAFINNEINVLCAAPGCGTAYLSGVAVVATALRLDGNTLRYYGTKITAQINKITLISSSSRHQGHTAFSLNDNNNIPAVGALLPKAIRTSCPTKILVDSNDVLMRVSPTGFYVAAASDPEQPSIAEPFAALIGTQVGTTVDAQRTATTAVQALFATQKPARIIVSNFDAGQEILDIMNNKMRIECLQGRMGCIGIFNKPLAVSRGSTVNFRNTNITIFDNRDSSQSVTSCSQGTATSQLPTTFIRTETMPYSIEIATQAFSTTVSSNSNFLLQFGPKVCRPFIDVSSFSMMFQRDSETPGTGQSSKLQITDMYSRSSFIVDFNSTISSGAASNSKYVFPYIKSFFKMINPSGDSRFPPLIKFNLSAGTKIGQTNSCGPYSTTCEFTLPSLVDGFYDYRFPSTIAAGSHIDFTGVDFVEDLALVNSRHQFRKCPTYFPANDPSGSLSNALPGFANCEKPKQCSLRLNCLLGVIDNNRPAIDCPYGRTGIDRVSNWNLYLPGDGSVSAQKDACNIAPPPTVTQYTMSENPPCARDGVDVQMTTTVKPYAGQDFPGAQSIEIVWGPYVADNGGGGGGGTDPGSSAGNCFLNETTNKTYCVDPASVTTAAPPPPTEAPISADHPPSYYGFAIAAEFLGLVRIVSKSGVTGPDMSKQAAEIVAISQSDNNNANNDENVYHVTSENILNANAINPTDFTQAQLDRIDSIPPGSVEFTILKVLISQRGKKATILVEPPARINKALTPVAAAFLFPDEALSCRNINSSYWMTPIVELPRPFSFVDVSLVRAGYGFVSGTTIALSALGGGGGLMTSMAARRYITTVRVFECASGADGAAEPVYAFDHPLQFAVGGSYAIGTLVGNFILTLGAYSVVGILFFVRRKLHKQDRGEAKIFSGFPEVPFSIATLFLHGSVMAMVECFVLAKWGAPEVVTSSTGGHVAAAVILLPFIIFPIFVVFRAVVPPSLFRLRARAYPTYLRIERKKIIKERKEKLKKKLLEEKKKKEHEEAKLVKQEELKQQLLSRQKAGDAVDEAAIEAKVQEIIAAEEAKLEKNKNLAKAAAAIAGKPYDGNDDAHDDGSEGGDSDEGEDKDDGEEEPQGCLGSIKNLLEPWFSRNVVWKDILRGSRFVERYAVAFEDISSAAYLSCFCEIGLTMFMAMLEGLPGETGQRSCSIIAMLKMLVAGLSFIFAILRPYCVRALNWHAIIVNVLGVTSLMLQVVSRYKGGSENSMELADLCIFIIFWFSIFPVIWMACTYAFWPSLRQKRLKKMIRTGCAAPKEKDWDEEEMFAAAGAGLPMANNIIPLIGGAPGGGQQTGMMHNGKILTPEQVILVTAMKKSGSTQAEIGKMLSVHMKSDEELEMERQIQQEVAASISRSRGGAKTANKNGDDNHDDELLGINKRSTSPYAAMIDARSGSRARRLTDKELEKIRKSSLYQNNFAKATPSGMVDEVLASQAKVRSNKNKNSHEEAFLPDESNDIHDKDGATNNNKLGKAQQLNNDNYFFDRELNKGRHLVNVDEFVDETELEERQRLANNSKQVRIEKQRRDKQQQQDDEQFLRDNLVVSLKEERKRKKKQEALEELQKLQQLREQHQQQQDEQEREYHRQGRDGRRHHHSNDDDYSFDDFNNNNNDSYSEADDRQHANYSYHNNRKTSNPLDNERQSNQHTHHHRSSRTSKSGGHHDSQENKKRSSSSSHHKNHNDHSSRGKSKIDPGNV